MKKGLVIKSTGNSYIIKKAGNNTYDCKIRGKFRIEGIQSTNPIAVGDWVEFYPEYTGNKNTGVITNICERKNYIIRKSSKLSKRTHIIAANIDTAFLIVTLAYPKTSTIFIDRFLITAEAYRIPINIIFNKIDLYDRITMKRLQELKTIYEKIGYKCYETSAIKNPDFIGIDIIRNLMKDKINVVSGHSGVGKTALLNALDKSLNLKTEEISDYHLKGKHTTAHTEMFELTTGGYIIDTPGIKGFGVIDMEKEEIYHFFPEMFKLSKNCQYYNCTHTHEPDCAVKQGLNNGTISESRYKSYLSVFQGDDDKYRM